MRKLLFQQGDFSLHSGEKSDFKIDCDALSDDDIESLAYIISKSIKFSVVYGVPTGGSRLEQALLKYQSGEYTDPVLICDDVLTTGKSIEDYKEKLKFPNTTGVVIFARGECPSWVFPMFQMWTKPKIYGK